MTEFTKTKVRDLAIKITKGTTPNAAIGGFTESGINFIKSESVSYDGRIDKSSFAFISPETHEKLKRSQLEKNDILFSMAGIFLGKNAVVKEDLLPANTNQALAIIRVDQKRINPIYLHYFFRQKAIIEYVNNISGQSAQPNINMEEIGDIELDLPSINQQNVICEVLSSLDDKIDLLHRNNKTLEEMAETLFRQWFVEGAKEDWEVGVLGDLVTVKRGGSPRPIQDYLSDSGLRWLKISDVTSIGSPFIFEIKEHIKPEGINKTVFLKEGSLVVSNSATPGIPKILSVDTCIHDGWLYFPESKLSKEFLYLFFLRIKEELVSLGNGSIFTNLKTDIVKSFPLVKPDEDTLGRFDGLIKPLFSKMYSNSVQLKQLINLRDSLLPKLMSGQIKVNP